MSFELKTIKRTLPLPAHPAKDGVHPSDREKLARAEADGFELYDVQGDEYRLRRPSSADAVPDGVALAEPAVVEPAVAPARVARPAKPRRSKATPAAAEPVPETPTVEP